jgi:hypothetical protein
MPQLIRGLFQRPQMTARGLYECQSLD